MMIGAYFVISRPMMIDVVGEPILAPRIINIAAFRFNNPAVINETTSAHVPDEL